jgi:hypothetical protein
VTLLANLIVFGVTLAVNSTLKEQISVRMIIFSDIVLVLFVVIRVLVRLFVKVAHWLWTTIIMPNTRWYRYAVNYEMPLSGAIWSGIAILIYWIGRVELGEENINLIAANLLLRILFALAIIFGMWLFKEAVLNGLEGNYIHYILLFTFSILTL